METPKLVAECVKVIQENCQIPVTIKCRIGIDDMDEIKGLDFNLNWGEKIFNLIKL